MSPLVDGQNQQRASGLMSIPVEIRLKIWSLLFLAHNARVLDGSGSAESKNSPLFQFAVPLLCTCCTIYKEAADVLYHENLWMMFTEENVLHNRNGWAFYTNESTQSRFVTSHRGLPLYFHSKIKALVTNPVLTVDISYSDLAMSRRSRKYRFAVPFESCILHQICDLLWERALKTRTNMTLSLGEQSRRSRSELHDLLLLPFKNIRALDQVTIKGAVSKKAGQDLKSTMKSQISSFPEFEAILQGYISEGNIFYSQKRYSEALLVYQTGQHFYSKIQDFPPDDTEDQDEADSDLVKEAVVRNRLSDALVKLSINAMAAALKTGDWPSVIALADVAFSFVRMLDSDRAKAHYRRGVAYFKTSKYKLAAIDLFYAFNILPNDSATKSWLRAAEEKLGFRAKTIAPLAEFPVTRDDGNTFIWTGDERLLKGPQRWTVEEMKNLDMYRMR